MGLLSSLTGGSKSTTTEKSYYDPDYKARQLSLLDRMDAYAAKPYDPSTFAGVNADQQAAWGMGRNLAGSNSGSMGEASSLLRGVLGNPVNAPTMQGAGYKPTFTGQASMIDPAAMARAGGVDRSSIGNVGVGAFNAQALQAFLNPATQQIVDAAMGDVERARLIQRNSDSAAMDGAWGGSRHGVADSLTNEAFQRTGASTAANLRGSAFDKASSLLMQHLGMGLQADMANQNADLGVAGMNSQIGQFNAGQQNQGLFFNADNQNRFSLANADIANRAGEVNAGFAQDAAGRNQSAQLQALLANQDAGIRGAGLLGNLSQQQFQNDAAKVGLLGQIGDQQREIEQSRLLAPQQYEQQRIANLLAAYGLNPTGTIGESTTKSKSSNGIGGIIQGLGSAMAGAAALSDRRLKTDIEKLGERPDGLGVYAFRYLWSPIRYIGVMAQEVLKVKPEAVLVMPNGYMAVDYGAL